MKCICDALHEMSGVWPCIAVHAASRSTRSCVHRCNPQSSVSIVQAYSGELASLVHIDRAEAREPGPSRQAHARSSLQLIGSRNCGRMKRDFVISMTGNHGHGDYIDMRMHAQADLD